MSVRISSGVAPGVLGFSGVLPNKVRGISLNQVLRIAAEVTLGALGFFGWAGSLSFWRVFR